MRLRNVKNKEEILSSCSFVIDNPTNYKGKWNTLFNNNNEINIEIGTGKCKFIYEMALKNPDINYIGIEKSASILAIATKRLEKLDNLYLINYDALKLDEVFSHEIDKIYLNFSDPWPKNRHENRRLTSPNFLKTYDKLFKKEKRLEFKTDNMGLFEYSICSLSNYGYIFESINLDLQNSENNDNIMTEYEYKFSQKGFKIYKLVAFKK